MQTADEPKTVLEGMQKGAEGNSLCRWYFGHMIPICLKLVTPVLITWSVSLTSWNNYSWEWGRNLSFVEVSYIHYRHFTVTCCEQPETHHWLGIETHD